MADAAVLNPGMVMDVAVGQPITIHPSIDGGRIVVTIEKKSGQRGRIRIQSEGDARIEPPKRDDRSN